MSNLAYNRGKTILAGAADWTAGGQTYRCLLATSAYSPAAGDDFVSAVTNELSGGGYVRKDITNRSAVENSGSARGDFKADNVSWSGLSSAQHYKWIVVYKFNTNDADSELICALDMTDVDLTGITDHTIKWDGQATNGRVFSIT